MSNQPTEEIKFAEGNMFADALAAYNAQENTITHYCEDLQTGERTFISMSPKGFSINGNEVIDDKEIYWAFKKWMDTANRNIAAEQNAINETISKSKRCPDCQCLNGNVTIPETIDLEDNGSSFPTIKIKEEPTQS